MAFNCPYCKRQFDLSLFQSGRDALCLCGYPIREDEVRRQVEERQRAPFEVRVVSRETLKRFKMRRLGRLADQVCFLIVNSDYPRVDIDIRIGDVRTLCEELFPDRMELFEMVYGSRFDRLWAQFREAV